MVGRGVQIQVDYAISHLAYELDCILSPITLIQEELAISLALSAPACSALSLDSGDKPEPHRRMKKYDFQKEVWDKRKRFPDGGISGRVPISNKYYRLLNCHQM